MKLPLESFCDANTTSSSYSQDSSCSTPPHNLQVTLTVKVNELHGLKQKYHQLEESECSLRSEVDKWRVTCQDKDEDLMKVTLEKEVLEKELESYITRTNVSMGSCIPIRFIIYASMMI